MLVLSRKKGQTIRIGDDIEITIVATANDQVKIGIQAPKNVEILRQELFEEIQAENKAATASIDNLLTNIKNLSNLKNNIKKIKHFRNSSDNTSIRGNKGGRLYSLLDTRQVHKDVNPTFKEEKIMRINHNIAALNTYRQLGSANNAQAKSMEKLSSGLRINSAGDDAAGLAISEKMRGQIRGLDQGF